MTEIVFVFWLVLSGGTIIPVPYQDRDQCVAAAEAVGAPKGMYLCVQQPRSDLKEWSIHRYAGGYSD